jgi:hypothetical protein
MTSVKRQLREEGYFQLSEVFGRPEMARLEAGLTALGGAGWPAPFVFLFDEPWLLYARLDGLLSELLGPQYRALAAFFAWVLERSDHSSGWRPHRDHTIRTVGEGGNPDSVTLWVPITEATPENGCIYVVPATRDPNYSGDLELADATSLQDVRALPAEPGSVLGWSHQLLHWGGCASPGVTSPRMSVSAEFQRNTGPALDEILDDKLPSFAVRLALVGKQLIAYQHMQQPSSQLLDIARALVEGTRYA